MKLNYMVPHVKGHLKISSFSKCEQVWLKSRQKTCKKFPYKCLFLGKHVPPFHKSLIFTISLSLSFNSYSTEQAQRLCKVTFFEKLFHVAQTTFFYQLI